MFRFLSLAGRRRRSLWGLAAAVALTLTAALVPPPALASDLPNRQPAQGTGLEAGSDQPRDGASSGGGVNRESEAVSGPHAGDETKERAAGAVRRGLLLAAAWVCLAVALAVVFVTLGRTLLWLRRDSSAKRAPPPEVFRLQLSVRTGAGQLRQYSFGSCPVTVASAGSADLLLPNPRGLRQRFRIDYRDGHGWFESDSPTVINGVPQRQKRLREGDRILFGSYRIYFGGAAFASRSPAVPARPRYAWQAPAVMALLVLAVLFRHGGGGLPRLGRSVRDPRPAPVAVDGVNLEPPSVVRRLPAAAPPQGSAGAAPEVKAPLPPPVLSSAPAAVPPTARATSAAPAARPPAPAPTAAPAAPGPVRPPPPARPGGPPVAPEERPRPETVGRLERAQVRTYGPGATVDFFRADVLFVHAHPDDESLDFAVLMSRAFRAGKRVATILFTDGEAGLDRYPRRPVGGLYPDHPLQGGALARVRVEEAREAMAILGSEAYVRLGLKNRPYNSLSDEVPLETVIEGWGGEAALVALLARLVRGFSPEVIVSPDSPSGAREHFEHEAVGYLVKAVVDRLAASGDNPVRAHLVSVGPLQREAYSETVSVDALARDPGSGLSHRAIQALALQQHATQADASVIGLRRLGPLPSEYYHAVLWSLPSSLEQWLEPASPARSSEPVGER